MVEETKSETGERKGFGKLGRIFSISRAKRTPEKHVGEEHQDLTPPSLDDNIEAKENTAEPIASLAAIGKPVSQDAAIETQKSAETLDTDISAGDDASKEATAKNEMEAADVPGEQVKSKAAEEDIDGGYETPPEEGSGRKYSVRHGESWQRLHDMFEKNPSVPKLVESPRLTKSKAEVGEIDKEHLGSVKELAFRLDHPSEKKNQTTKRENLEQALKTPDLSPTKVADHPNLPQ